MPPDTDPFNDAANRLRRDFKADGIDVQKIALDDGLSANTISFNAHVDGGRLLDRLGLAASAFQGTYYVEMKRRDDAWETAIRYLGDAGSTEPQDASVRAALQSHLEGVGRRLYETLNREY